MGTGKGAVGFQRQERPLAYSASGTVFWKRWNYLKAYSGRRRCFSAGSEKEAPDKPIGCSFKQNPARQFTEIFLFWRALLQG